MQVFEYFSDVSRNSFRHSIYTHMSKGFNYLPIKNIEQNSSRYRLAEKLCLLVVLLCANIVSKGQTPSPCVAPTITSVNPLTGISSSSVTITGTNFNITAANDHVFFGAVQATVTAATATQLTVNVPKGATYGPIVVDNTSCGLQGAARLPFLQNFNNGIYIPSTVNLDPKADFNTGTSPWGVAIGDIDGDGKPDVVVANSGSSTISLYRNTSASGTITSGSFAAAVNFSTGSSPEGVAIGDIDGDGKLDIVVTNSGSATVSVFRNTATSGIINLSSLAGKVDFTSGNGPESVAIGDIDGDGKPEIITANSASPGGVSVLQNNSTSGSISFSAKVDFATSTISPVVAIGDLDGDGRPDVVATNFAASSVSVLRNTGASGTITSTSLATKVDFTTGTNPAGLALADVDGDGNVDIVVANFGSGSVGVFRNTASGVITTGSFAGMVSFGALSQPFSVSVGDIDGDGKPDLAVGYIGSQISIYRNTSFPGFITVSSLATDVDFGAGGNPRQVTVGDLDLDGLADVVSTNQSSGTFSVLRNDPLQPITGNLVLCQSGPTSALSEPARGGTWLSGTPSVASVSVTGVVSGVGAGTSVISYVAPGGSVYVTVTVNPAPVASFTVTSNPVCFGTSSTFADGSGSIASYSWTFGDASTSSINNVAHTYSASGTYNATLTVIHTDGCSASQTVAVTVNPIPALSSTLTPAGICNGNVFNYTPTSAVSGTNFNWSRAVIANISNGAASGTNNPGEALNNTGVNPVAVVYVYSLSANGCSNLQNVTVSVNPTPVLTSTLTPGAICNSTTFNYPPTSATTGATFLWYRPAVSGVSNPTTSGGNNPNEILINTTTDPVAVTYQFTLGINGCSNTQNVIVTVNPTPMLTSTLTPAAICSGTTFNYIPTSLTGGAAFTWTRATVAGISNGAASGSNNPGETLNNTATNPVAVTYVYSLTANGCSNTQNVTVSVNPISVLTSTLTPSAICNNTLFSYTPTSATAGSTFNWSRATVAGISNAAASGADNPAETLTNTATAPVAVTYVYTLSINGCTNVQNVTVSVNPTPLLTSTLTPVAICNNTAFNYTPTSATIGTTFNWSRATVAGISNAAASGINNPGETLTNTGTVPVVVTYVYTLTAHGCSNIQDVTVTVNPTPALSGTLTPGGICSNTVFSYSAASLTSGTTFAWSRAAVTGISNAAATGLDDPDETLIDTSAGAVVVTYVYTLTANGCSNIQNVIVTVSPAPALSSTLTPGSICSNNVFSYVPTSPTGGTTFAWSRALVTGVSNGAASGANNPDEILTDTTASPVAVVYVYTLTANGCSSIADVTVMVNPGPLLSSPRTLPAMCNNSLFSYVPTSLTGSVTFEWSRAGESGLGNGAASGSNNPNETLSDTGANPVAVTYVYTLTAGGCGSTQNVTVSVNPTPVLSSALASNTACSSNLFDYTPTSNTIGATFNWSRATVAGISNGAASGADDPNETLVNTTTNPVAVVYVYTLSINGCTNTQNVTVTVNPLPVLSSTLTPAAICNNTVFNYTPTSGTDGATFGWSRAATTGISNGDASGAGNPGETLTDTIANPVVVTYVYTVTASGCNSIENVTVSVNPTPVLSSAVEPGAVCSGSLFSYTPTSLTTAATFNWSRAAVTGISNGDASGSNDPAEALTDTSAASVVVTYTYTLTVNGCSNTQNVTVTVNPTPVLSSTLTPGSLCNNSVFNYTPTSILPATTFAWSRAAMTGIGNPAASGADNPGETLTDTTAAPVAVAYVYTLTTSGCANMQIVTVTVNPSAVLSSTLTPAPICDSMVFDYVPASTATGAAFAWSRAAIIGIAEGAGSGAGDPAEQLINTTTDPVGVVYTYTITANGCSSSQNIVVTVNPTPMLNSLLSEGPICDSSVFDYTPTSATTGTAFAWSRAEVAGMANIAGSGIGDPTEQLINTTSDPVAVTYTYTLTANGCSNMQTMTVTVNPAPMLTSTLTPASICDSTLFDYTPLSATTGTTFAWSRAAIPGITNPAAAGADDPLETLVNTTPDPIPVAYTYTLTANGCSNVQQVVVVVNPVPQMLITTTPSTICDNTTFTYVASSLTSGAVINWSRDSVTGISNAAGSGTDTVNEVLVNTTTNAITVTYVNALSIGGCNDTTTVSVTVEPLPTLSTATTPPDICDSMLFHYVPGGNVPGTVFTWHRLYTPGIPLLGEFGADSVNETLVNDIAHPVSVTYVYTLTANGCSNTENVNVTVNPKPLLNTGTAFAQCDSLLFHYHAGSATSGFSYSWVREYAPGILLVPGGGTGDVNDSLINTTNDNVNIIYNYSLSANGCSDSEQVVVTVHPTPLLSTTTTPAPVCSGLPVGYMPGSNTSASTFAWSHGTAAGILPATGSGTGEINEVLTNTTSSVDSMIYVVTLTAYGCSHSEDVFIEVKTSPAPPVITTVSAGAVCDETMYQNFGAATPPVNETYAWSATGADVVSQGTNGQYCIVNFTTPGSAVITLTATIDSSGCVSAASYTVAVSNSSAAQPYVIYAGGQFICLENDVTSYQWGYDSKATLDSTILVGEINQGYINGSPDTLNNYYWVITTHGDCSNKAYYNGPVSTAVSVINGSTEMKVYPNPTSDYVNVEVSGVMGGKMSVTVMNMLGQEITRVGAANNKAVIDASKLAPGIYVVECYRDGLKTGTAKFIKN